MIDTMITNTHFHQYHSNITYHIKNNIAYVIIQRPEKRNALSFDMLNALINIAQHIQTQRELRAVILMGENHFSAGIDTESFKNKKQQRFALWQLIKPQPSLFQQACLIWQRLPIPVIAVIQGYCFGAGLQLILGADIRIASQHSRFSIMENKIGLVADMGISQLLKNQIGLDHAKELAMTARIIDATYAKNIGLVSHISDDPLQYAEQLIMEIMQNSPDAVMASKKILNATQFQSIYGLALEKYWQTRLILGKNQKIALKRIKDKSIPYFNRLKF